MLNALFQPRGVVVVGASRNPAKLGYGVARNLIVSGYRGALHFVNPGGGTLFDRPVHLDLASVPDPVDLAMIIIPAAAVPQALEDCGQRGVRVAIIGSGGFREIGPVGQALETRCLEIARRHGMRVLGPNSIGFLDTHLPIDTSFLPLPGPTPGDVAFLSHSGAICEAVIDWARGQGFGLSQLLSLGNQMDLSESELLPEVASDPHTRVIALYLEGVSQGRGFVENALRVSREKPVVALKVGRSSRGRAAVASHTGALAGDQAAYAAAFRKAGIVQAESSEETFDWARALAWCPLPGGPNVAVLTNAGGPGALAVDALDACGLQLADLSAKTVEGLKELLPPAASLHNPVDMLAAAGPAEYGGSLRLLLADAGVHSVLLILPPPPMSTAADVAGAILPVVRGASKPVVVALMGEDLIVNAARLFRQSHIPDYRFPERAASALKVLVERAAWLAAPVSELLRGPAVERAAVEGLLRSSGDGRSGFLPAPAAERLAAACGIPTPGGGMVRSPEEAVELAGRVGYPVALKLISSAAVHKSDVGGVRLGLMDAAALKEAFGQLAQAAGSADGFEGALLQPMLSGGQEVIVGMVRDPQFGPLLMFGSGGLEVEGLGDVSFALAPLTLAEANGLLDSTWAGRKLAGYRSLAAGDRGAVVQTLAALGQLGMDFPQVAEAEINPLYVLPEGRGVCALDVRIRLAPD
ncbi:MAG TPA: acetate--CoA ligase family protein [Anaerolineales bacterium]|nr:acetate--CoA ligase family protein [Anaerolineales bacterium]